MREGLGKEVVLCFASKSSGGNESNSEHLDKMGSLIRDRQCIGEGQK